MMPTLKQEYIKTLENAIWVLGGEVGPDTIDNLHAYLKRKLENIKAEREDA